MMMVQAAKAGSAEAESWLGEMHRLGWLLGVVVVVIELIHAGRRASRPHASTRRHLITTPPPPLTPRSTAALFVFLFPQSRQVLMMLWLQVTSQPVSVVEDVHSARNKGAAGTAGYQNKRFIDPILKDEREDEMNANLGFVVHL